MSIPAVLDGRRRSFAVGRFRFQFPRQSMDALMNVLSTCVDICVYIIGPVLICFALAITAGLTYTFFWILLPMLERYNEGNSWIHFKIRLHVLYVIFILINVLYNYALCVVTSNKGAKYDRAVRELAVATGYQYPETPEEILQFKVDYQDKMILRAQRRQARAQNNTNPPEQAVQISNDSSGGTITQRHATSSETSNNPANQNNRNSNNGASNTRRVPYGWMVMGPQEWGFCPYSNQPKPPRSHFDHVTKMIILNMDHYCPWMFNCVGYFNYRYFCNFLIYVFAGLFYGAVLSYKPFRLISAKEFGIQARWSRRNIAKDGVTHMFSMVPLPVERSPIAFTFMLCVSVGIAVACLLGFHLYLIFTAQTTIEFHGNCIKKRNAKKRKTAWINPYDLGNGRNWQQVYGSGNPLIALLPSSREPEFFPVPIAGDNGRRHVNSNESVTADETRSRPDLAEIV